ncbi:tetratricopeptide repeat protein [Saccharicrinis aurantiacus]|uniref:tetratricopeptide repeat protein n=1 Tax=Saccharicrinis aurantiacus TaxID=1849719 RepID=UPI0024907E9A|nr:hypothetical protein [Saccharicrinis aurantiacus]
MEIQEIKKLNQEINNALCKKQIKDALAMIGNLAKQFQSGSIIDDHYNIQFTYKSLLSYAVEGVNDPEQQKMYDKIIGDTFNLSDRLFSFIYKQKSSDYLYQLRRQSDNANSIENVISNFYEALESDALAGQIGQQSNTADESIKHIFNKLFSVHDISLSEHKAIVGILLDEDVNYTYRALFVSAITVGLLQEFSLEKLLVLFEVCSSKTQEVRQRSLVGLILSLYKYDNRLKYYPTITKRIDLLVDDEKNIKAISSLLINLIRTRETEKIITKLNEEILPEVVKMHPNLRNKLDIDDMIGEKFIEGENPDWEDFFKDSPELKSKLEEITEWQMEGADVFLSTFKTLKHFPFFNDVHNWLIPFDVKNPALAPNYGDDQYIFGSKSVQESLTKSGFLCNSDKYSLFLSVPFMPSFQKDMMAKMFEQQLEQIEDIEKDDSLVKPDKKEANINNRYIQDLYRLYKLYPHRNQFEDVFAWKMAFHKKQFFSTLFKDQSYLRQIGEFYFKKQYYLEASEVFAILLADNSSHVELIQKSAYSLQQVGKYTEALDLYLRADILKTDQLWTIKKIALMYKSIGKPQESLNYYLQAEKLKPEDLHTQALIGHCHLDLKNYKDALKYYFKVEYLDSTNTKVWSPIAWCSFVSGNFEQAEKYYQKLLISSSNNQDLINIGHVYLCLKDRKQALVYYKKAINLMNNSEEFFNTFYEDQEQLILNGVDELDLPIIIDQLKYSIEE